jgi:hypothetical protein
MKWIIWKERNVAKYQKQIATKSKRIHILKAEISFYFHTQHIKLGTKLSNEESTSWRVLSYTIQM